MFEFAYKYLRPVWDWFAGGISAILHLGDYGSSKRKLNQAKREVESPEGLEDWYKDNDIEYKEDKSLDYAKRPWVTIADNGGDCEDFTALSYEILKNMTECKRGFCNSKDGGGHSIMIARHDDEKRWWLMSNYNCTGPFNSEKEAGESFYGKKTTRWFFI